jgi:hypothetical protein
MSSTVANCIEQVVAGASPACRLSHRAEAALDQARATHEFVDGNSLPLVVSGNGRLIVWGFAGSAAMASIASALSEAGISVSGFDNFSITVNDTNIRKVSSTIGNLDPDAVHPRLPERPAEALKFGLCLPESVSRAVLELRSSDATAAAAVCKRPLKTVRVMS